MHDITQDPNWERVDDSRVSVEWEPNPANKYAPGVLPETHSTKPHQAKLRSFPEFKEAGCGHKIDLQVLPTGKCPGCWGLFFTHHVDMTSANISVYQEGRKAEISAVHGNRYVTMLSRFIEWLKAMKEIKEAQENAECAEEAGDGTDRQSSAILETDSSSLPADQ